MQKTLGTYKPKEAPKEKSQQDQQAKQKQSDDTTILASLSVADYIKTADEALTYRGNYNVMLPADKSAPAMITKTKLGFFAPAAGDRITMDQHNGSIIKVEIFKKKPFNERVAGSIKAIHVGNVYGTFTKLLYFLACLIATSLPVTGTLIWINKLKKKRKPTKPVIAISMAGKEQLV